MSQNPKCKMCNGLARESSLFCTTYCKNAYESVQGPMDPVLIARQSIFADTTLTNHEKLLAAQKASFEAVLY